VNLIKKTLAHVCDNCPFCNYARSHPETTIGKVMEWHGNYCPAWKGQKELERDRDQGSGVRGQDSNCRG
tara:strand:+ start:156 stop:362 length:207 start_codon:yes stop_codon:yes gene_type:complete